MNAAITETYQEVAAWIQQTVQDYRRAAGGDPEELAAEANQHFVEAYHNYDSRLGSFTNHVRFRVTKGLQETGRNHIRKDANRRVTRDLSIEPARTREDVLAWASTLSPDAQLLVKFAINPTKDILMEAAFRRGGMHNPNALRTSLFGYMREMQWPIKRIAAAFKEISDNLNWEAK